MVFRIQEGADYLIKVSYIDNRTSVSVNGQQVLNESGNGNVSYEVNISAYFKPAPARNFVTVEGYNQAYPGGNGKPRPARFHARAQHSAAIDDTYCFLHDG